MMSDVPSVGSVHEILAFEKNLYWIYKSAVFNNSFTILTMLMVTEVDALNGMEVGFTLVL